MTGPDPRLVGSAAHVFVTSIEAPELGTDDRHHLERVLRLRSGDLISCSDGAGLWRLCRLVPGGGLEPVDSAVAVPEPRYEITIAFAPPKGDRPELIVQKLTELGVDRIVPMTTDRTVVRWDAERAARQLGRWQRIIHESGMQSRRVRLPVLEPITAFADMADRPGAQLAAPGGGAIGGDARLLLIGPEGGWSDDELRRPLSRVGLGDQVLRTETAALAACALAVSARATVVG